MVNDIRDFVKTCDVCQRNNDVKFIKADTALHPIPVKSKVWYQVHNCIDFLITVYGLMYFHRLVSI